MKTPFSFANGLKFAQLSLAALLTGCATADFMPYAGAQQKWPTAPGAFVKTIDSYDGPGRSGTGQQYTLPVYFGPPNRSYVVLGSVDVDTQVGRLFEGSETTTTLKPAVRVAGQHGADAIIVIAQDVETRGYSTMSFAQGNSNTSFSGAAYGNAVFGHANTTANAWGSSFTMPNRRGQARVLAIKFI
jgi:hypothetical protein